MLDEKRLRQVLLNLLGNAVKFTDHGQLSLRIRRLPNGNGGAHLRFEVEDTGIGIAEDQLEAVFKPFEQSGTEPRGDGGTGLGLAISRDLVRLMDSDIHVNSQPGQGSVFWFDLHVPLVEADIVPSAPEKRIIGYEGLRKKILIVDDVKANRAVATNFLSLLGFETQEARNGREALQQTSSFHPDLILMDVVMPGMDGLAATRELRRHPKFKMVPVIAVSASTSDIDKEKSMTAGANAFVNKPFDFNTLLNEIGVLLSMTWEYESAAQQASPPVSTPAGPLVAPPPNEMDTLRRLARIGDMRGIREHAGRIAELGDQYRAFAERLRTLASRYQSRAIVELVERFNNHE